MARTKLFISYSHRDDDWLDRLRLHLSILERRKIVHVWSDTRIRVGDVWKAEIETALTESKAAVLMITPAFLASDYIWEEEMPHILRHARVKDDPMKVFPLIMKPCAWKIADELADFQSRPTNGRPLALGTDSTIDSDLADFVYELAGLLGQSPSSVAAAEMDRNLRHGQTVPLRTDTFRNNVQREWLNAGGTWTGIYRPSNRRMELMIRSSADGPEISGTIDYPAQDDGAETAIEGRVLDRWEVDADPLLAGLASSTFDGALSFREVREVRSGRKSVVLGEYHAIVVGGRMVGFWKADGFEPRPFEFLSPT